jgi:hypothetical protein
VRIHRYAESFQITDLTNAGKRGKRVRVMSLSPSYSYPGKPQDWMESMSKELPDYPSYDGIKRFISNVLVDHPGQINVSESEARGVDVNPGGTEKITLESAEGISITALPDDFVVRSTTPRGLVMNDTDLDTWSVDLTLYYQVSKKDAAVFYNWLKANRAEAARMTIADFRKLWHQLGVQYDYHSP